MELRSSFDFTDGHLFRITVSPDTSPEAGDFTLRSCPVSGDGGCGDLIDPVGENPLMEDCGEAQGDLSIGVTYDGDDVGDSLNDETGDS